MTDILLDKGISDSKEAKACIYKLKNEEMFSQLGYKVMLSQKVPALLPAMRVKNNGKTEFVYITKGYQPFQSLVATLPREGAFLVCAKVIEAILRVKNQGFLLTENIDVVPERIYFDPKTYEAHLVYLPLSADEENCEAKFNGLVRHLLLQFIKMSNAVVSEQERTIVDALTNGGVSLEEIARLVGQNIGIEKTDKKAKNLHLVSMNPNLPLNTIMKNGSLKIGRKKDNDLVLDFTNQISRLHCRLYERSGEFFVKDENSSFGTGLNGRKLPQGQPMSLKNGDVLMLPGIKLKIEIK